MNPGIINALVADALTNFGKRIGQRASLEGLDIASIFFSEVDGSEALDEQGYPQRWPENAFPMTWSPEHCLEELFEEETMICREGTVIGLQHASTEAYYAVRCGKEEIEGYVVPHEEVLTLGHYYAPCEVAYIYRLPKASRDALDGHPQRRKSVRDWPNRPRMYPPQVKRLRGSNRIGVLLCSKSHGEYWLGWETDNRDTMPASNATLHQVAVGIWSGWIELRRMQAEGIRGIHLVEELPSRDFFRRCEALLGPLQEHYEPELPYRSLLQRRKPSTP